MDMLNLGDDRNGFLGSQPSSVKLDLHGTFRVKAPLDLSQI